MPGFDLTIGGYTLVPNPFWGGALFPLVVFGFLYSGRGRAPLHARPRVPQPARPPARGAAADRGRGGRAHLGLPRLPRGQRRPRRRHVRPAVTCRRSGRTGSRVVGPIVAALLPSASASSFSAGSASSTSASAPSEAPPGAAPDADRPAGDVGRGARAGIVASETVERVEERCTTTAVTAAGRPAPRRARGARPLPGGRAELRRGAGRRAARSREQRQPEGVQSRRSVVHGGHRAASGLGLPRDGRGRRGCGLDGALLARGPRRVPGRARRIGGLSAQRRHSSSCSKAPRCWPGPRARRAALG